MKPIPLPASSGCVARMSYVADRCRPPQHKDYYVTQGNEVLPILYACASYSHQTNMLISSLLSPFRSITKLFLCD